MLLASIQTEERLLLRHSVHTKMLVAILALMTFVSAPLAVLGQKASPVAPGRAQVEAVVREAYEKFKKKTGSKKDNYIPYLAQVDSKLFKNTKNTTNKQKQTKKDNKKTNTNQSISK